MSRVTPSMVGGFHFGFWSLSISSARTPSKKSWSGRMAVLRHAVLDGHRILERTVGAALELLQRDRHGQAARASSARRAACRAHSPRLLLELGHDLGDRIGREAAIDVAHQRRQATAGRHRRRSAAITASTLRLASGPERSAAPSAACSVVHLRARHVGIDDARPQRVGRLQAMAGQRQEDAQRARQAASGNSRHRHRGTGRWWSPAWRTGTSRSPPSASRAPRGRRRRPCRCRRSARSTAWRSGRCGG